MLKCKFLSSIYRPSTTSRQLTSDFWPFQTKFVLLPTLKIDLFNLFKTYI